MDATFRSGVQVHMMEDEDNHIHFRNLSIHRATNEEEALNLVRLRLWLPACTARHSLAQP
jgi:hypothetical protein